jgi:5-methylcytosine-specific restriction endonuclease McrA
MREITYELKYTYAQLILGGTSLAEAKETGYVDSQQAEMAWLEVAKNPQGYTPMNETAGAVWATWDIYEVLSDDSWAYKRGIKMDPTRVKRLETEIGYDTEKWSNSCLVPYPKWVNAEIDKLVDAVRIFISGDKKEAVVTLRSIRERDMNEWYLNVGQWSGQMRQGILKLKPPVKVSKDKRDQTKVSTKVERQIIERDNYCCQYCGIPLIHTSEIVKLQKMFGRDQLPRRKQGAGGVEARHGIFSLCQATFDHVEPHQIGGKNSAENLISSCFPCNFGKKDWTLEQLGLTDPRTHQIRRDGWHGLTDLFELMP